MSTSTYYYKPVRKTTEQEAREDKLRGTIDKWHTKMPYLGSRKLVTKLKGVDLKSNLKITSLNR